MKKKGFTLIELLSAIIILAIMLVVAIPRILNAIETAKINTYKNGNKVLMKAADTYLMDNIGIAPTQIGDSIEITVNDLITANYLKPINDPRDKSSTCNGYVLVTKLNEASFDYNPNLKCGSSNTITSSTQDGLILYQKFDEFKEPTTNLVMDSGVINWTITALGAGTVTRTTITTNDRYKITTDATAVAFRFYIPLAKLTNGLSYNLSYKYKINKGTTFTMTDWNDTTLSNVVNNTYKKYNYSSASGTKATYDSTFRFMDFYMPVNSEVEIWDVQLEQRTFATDFTNSIRNATVYDITNNNNDGVLAPTTSPLYVENGRSGTGAYDLNGTNRYIDFGNSSSVNLTNTGSIILYAKPDRTYPSDTTTTAWRGIISKTVSGSTGGYSYFIDWFGSNTTRTLRAGIGDSVGGVFASTSYDFNNSWNQIAMVWNGSTLILYANGAEIARATQDRNPLILSTNLKLGSIFGGCFWDGLIDDVRVYNRALTSDEIKLNYDLNK